MHNIKSKIVLRAYPKTFEWESLEEWNTKINEALDGISVYPIGMDGVLITYKDIDKSDDKYYQGFPS
ncbi:MAG: hypothetical protein WA421_14645 [Nitrososphaeraceae archaeon]